MGGGIYGKCNTIKVESVSGASFHNDCVGVDLVSYRRIAKLLAGMDFLDDYFGSHHVHPNLFLQEKPRLISQANAGQRAGRGAKITHYFKPVFSDIFYPRF